MSVHISTKTVQPVRNNFDYTARRIGKSKTASRYQEAVYDIQPTTNFHYPPTWEQGKDIYDVTRTSIVMEDWYKFTDPRQYYYTSYVSARAKQQESMDNNITMTEKNGLLKSVSSELLNQIKSILVPLRHVEYGANMNNQDICDKGYGTSITSLASFNGFDRIGIAQYISRIALLIDENEEEGLLQGKKDWIESNTWQPLRHAMEDIFVLEDWFEIMVAQNVVMDGLIYPLIYDKYIKQVAGSGAGTLVLLTQFMSDWYKETTRWTNELLKVTAAESDENKKLLSDWSNKWIERLEEALTPISSAAFNGNVSQLSEVRAELEARIKKQGINL